MVPALRLPLLLSIMVSGLSLAPSHLYGQDLVFGNDEFVSWRYPAGLVDVTADGFSVKPFGTTFNAVADIDEHSSILIGNFGSRPARSPSNQAHADRIRDQDPSTWWKPYPDDSVQERWIELDLGRAVVADRIRVIFPDEEGARPFSFFSVYTSPGIPVFGGSPRILYTRVGRPVSNNTEQTVEFTLQTTGLRGAAGAHLDTNSTMPFDVIRFIRFEAAAATPDAALAEIEVDGVGFNLGSMVGTPTRRDNDDPHWGGTTWTSKDRDCEGCGKGSGADEMIDEDLGFRTWTTESEDKGEWRKTGVWQVIDFGSVFRVNRVIFFPIVAGRSPIIYGYERDKQGPWSYLDLLTSDGSGSSSSDAEVEGLFHYELLSEVVNGTNSADPRFRSHYGRHLFDFNFEPLDVRLLLWRAPTVQSAFSRALQIFVFHAEGYPAQVEMESDDIPLGSGLSIRSIEWDADTPPGTSIQVATQTGNGFSTVKRYLLVNGREVTKAAYDAAKSRNRGEIIEEQVRDATWSDWSLPHRFSGQDFQSPSPRQWLRIRVRLLSDDPERMPTLRQLRFLANQPIVAAGVQGEIFPHEAPLDFLQEFRYTVTPLRFGSRDAGFDRVVINLPPGSGDVRFTQATIRGVQVDATAEILGDSLLVRLPPPAVRRDSVEILFQARLVDSPTVFSAFVSNSDQEASAQGVIPSQFGADQVHLPEAIAGRSLVRNLAHTTAFSPNGDGVNDEYELNLTVVKTNREPTVRLFDLAGQLVTELQNQSSETRRGHYIWDGRGQGQMMPPGVYILQIEVNSDARKESIHRTVSLVY